jgi:RNAse (barnase) inhibitor barstar
MTTFRLELAHVSSMAEFQDRVVRDLRFPAYYGRNLDAFWDCIRLIGPNDVVEIVDRDKLGRSISAQADRYIELIREASEREDCGFELRFL